MHARPVYVWVFCFGGACFLFVERTFLRILSVLTVAYVTSPLSFWVYRRYRKTFIKRILKEKPQTLLILKKYEIL